MTLCGTATRRPRSGTVAFSIAHWPVAATVAALIVVCAAPTMAQAPPAPPTDATALAKEQQNPISSMATIPWQMNFNSGGGYWQADAVVRAQQVWRSGLTALSCSDNI